MIDLPPLDPGVEIVAASQGMSKGILQAEDGQMIAKGFLQLGPVQVGGQWKNVTSPVADGEAAAFANVSRRFGSWQVSLGLTYKWLTGVDGPTDSRAMEISAGMSRQLGPLQLRLIAVYSPDEFGTSRESLYVEGGPALDLDRNTRLSAHVSRRERAGNVDYTAFNIGATRTITRGVTLDVRYYDTAQSELGKSFRPRLVLSGRWTF